MRDTFCVICLWVWCKNPFLSSLMPKGRTIGKVMGSGVGKNQKQFMQGRMTEKNIVQRRSEDKFPAE